MVRRARQILKELEEAGPTKILVPAVPPLLQSQPEQTTLADPVSTDLRRRVEALSVETMTPIEALNTLYELKKMTE